MKSVAEQIPAIQAMPPEGPPLPEANVPLHAWALRHCRHIGLHRFLTDSELEHANGMIAELLYHAFAPGSPAPRTRRRRVFRPLVFRIAAGHVLAYVCP